MIFRVREGQELLPDNFLKDLWFVESTSSLKESDHEGAVPASPCLLHDNKALRLLSELLETNDIISDKMGKSKQDGAVI